MLKVHDMMGEITLRSVTPRPLSWSESASLLGVVCYESEPHSSFEWNHSFGPSLHWSELLNEWTPLILRVNSLFWCFTPLEWSTGGVKWTHFWSDITPKFLQCIGMGQEGYSLLTVSARCSCIQQAKYKLASKCHRIWENPLYGIFFWNLSLMHG